MRENEANADGDELTPVPPPFKARIKKSEALWLMSFSDLCLVLMCFFVLLLSFSTPNKKKFDNVRHGMKKEANTSTADEKSLEELQTMVERIIKKRKLEKLATVTLAADGLAIEFKNALVFSSGSAEASPRFRRVLRAIQRTIAKAPSDYKLVIEGHTDDIPIQSPRFRSNWHLSAERGFTLLNMLSDLGVAKERMSVVALADTRPKVSPAGLSGDDLKAAQAANRRVVIRLE